MKLKAEQIQDNWDQLLNFIDQYIFYSLTIGDERTSSLNFDLNTLFFQFKFPQNLT